MAGPGVRSRRGKDNHPHVVQLGGPSLGRTGQSLGWMTRVWKKRARWREQSEGIGFHPPPFPGST